MSSLHDFRDVPGFPLYQVNGFGAVRREQPLGDYRTIHHSLNANGYPSVRITLGNQRKKRVSVHKLLLLAFRGPRPAGMVARHLNGNKADCRITNLCWGTCKENEADKVIHGTRARGRKINTNKLTEEQVLEIRRLRAAGWTLKRIATLFLLNLTTVHAITLRKIWAWLPDTQ